MTFILHLRSSLKINHKSSPSNLFLYYHFYFDFICLLALLSFLHIYLMQQGFFAFHRFVVLGLAGLTKGGKTDLNLYRCHSIYFEKAVERMTLESIWSLPDCY